MALMRLLLHETVPPSSHIAPHGVLRSIQAPLVIPMHYFGQATLERFAAGLEQDYVVEYADGNAIEISRETLPPIATMLVLPPG